MERWNYPLVTRVLQSWVTSIGNELKQQLRISRLFARAMIQRFIEEIVTSRRFEKNFRYTFIYYSRSSYNHEQ